MQAAWLIAQGSLQARPAMLPTVSAAGLFGHRLLRWAILAVDRLLRRWYGVREFTDDPACLLRIAPGAAPTTVRLADGIGLAQGDPMLDLHLWNEQLPRYHGGRFGLAWAIQFRAAFERSLRLLAAEMATDPALVHVRALRAETTFVTRGRGPKLARIAFHYGFSAPRMPSIGPGRPRRDLGGDLLVFGLTLACNPLSLRGKTLRRDRYGLWISRQQLLALYHPLAAMPDQTTAAASDRNAAA